MKNTLLKMTILTSLIYSSLSFSAASPLQISTGEGHICQPDNFCVLVQPDVTTIPVETFLKLNTEYSIQTDVVVFARTFPTSWTVSANPLELMSIKNGVVDMNTINNFHLAIMTINGKTVQNCQVDLTGNGSIYPGERVTLVLHQNNGEFSCY